MDAKDKNIGIIGFGHLGYALCEGLSKVGYNILINNGTLKRTRQKFKERNIKDKEASTLKDIARECKILLLCIKHGQSIKVATTLNRLLNEEHIVISCMAQATLSEVDSLLRKCRSRNVKAMMNLAAESNQAVSAYQLNAGHDEASEARVNKLLSDVSAADCVLRLESEYDMQLFTVLVGCFPGIMARFLGELEASAKKYGNQSFSRYGKMVSTLVRSSANLIDLYGSTELLEKKVKTPLGVTDTMLNSFEQNGLSKIIDGGIVAGLQKMRGK